MTVLLIVVVTTLAVSAVCSLFESTLYSTRLATLEAAKTRGRHQRSAAMFWGMKKDVAGPTSAILILNTVANTAGATVAGMLAAQEFGGAYVPLFSAILTLAILMFSEIIPKTFGAVHWRFLWPYVAWPLAAIQTGLRPLVWLTQRFASLLVSSKNAPLTTQDEVLAMIQLGAKAGELSATELELLTAVFHFDEVVCRQVMVPRNQISFLQQDWTLEQCMHTLRTTRHTRYPVCNGGLDNSLGLIHVKDLVGMELAAPVRGVVRAIHTVPETMPIPRLLREMQQTHRHMALVVDEHGSTVGVVTLENVLEQIVGSVQDEFDNEEPDIVKRDEGSFVVRGAVAITRLNRELGIRLPHPVDVDTLSGLLVRQIGRLLRVGDRANFPGVDVEVLDIVGNRATRIRITVAAPVPVEEEEAL